MADELKSAQNVESGNNDINRIAFQVKQYIQRNVHTTLPVRVKKCYPKKPGKEEDAEKAGLVNVELAIEQIDTKGELVETKVLYNVPYTRLQGKNCAFVVDPEPEDWGWVSFCERDISKWKRTMEKSLPGSYRMYDQADGIYLGGIKNDEPKIYVRLHYEDGIIIESDTTDLTVHIGGKSDIHMEGDVKWKCDGNVEWEIGKDFTLKVDGKMDTTVSKDLTEKAQNIWHN